LPGSTSDRLHQVVPTDSQHRENRGRVRRVKNEERAPRLGGPVTPRRSPIATLPTGPTAWRSRLPWSGPRMMWWWRSSALRLSSSSRR